VWARANSDWFYRSNDLERQAVECNTGLRLAQGVFGLESRNLGMDWVEIIPASRANMEFAPTGKSVGLEN
jgi:hypothetical protein